MRIKLISLAVLLSVLTLLVMTVIPVTAEDGGCGPVYNINTNEYFNTIQDALDAETTENGHTIRVNPGNYSENVKVTKELIIESTGENTRVMAADSRDHVFEVASGNVTIRGFAIDGTSTTSNKAGIWLQSVSNCTIENNKIGMWSANDIGINLYRSSSNTVRNNYLTDNDIGINLQGASDNLIDGNMLEFNKHFDIRLEDSPYQNGSNSNIISQNTCSGGGSEGIYINSSNNNSVTGNTVENKSSADAIELNNSNNNIITRNSVSCIMGLNNAGIKLGSASYPSEGNTVFLNAFYDNYKNIINSGGALNRWFSTEEIDYLYSGKAFRNYLGNYFDDYAGNDADNDGVGDTSYPVINDDNDAYPLIADNSNYTEAVICSLQISSLNGGTITAPGEGLFYYPENTSVTLEATPTDGFRFLNWSGDVSSITDANSAYTTVTMSGNYSITAIFSPIVQYALYINSAHGTVQQNPDLEYYDEGSAVELTANPDEGWTFSGWSGDLNGNDNPASLIMDDHKTVTANYTAVIPDTPVISLTAPEGGESWVIGSSQEIAWTSRELTGNVKIELSRDNGSTWETVFASTNNDGRESWTVSGAASSQALVRVSGVDNPNIFDVSDAVFSLVEPVSITVTSPNGGETCHIGLSQLAITWTSTNLASDELVMIELSRDNGNTWISCGLSTPNDGFSTWTVSEPVSEQALIRVFSVTDPSVCDVSDAVFTIAPLPSITVISPNGDETWNAGSIKTISWESTYLPSGALVDIIFFGGSGWPVPIATGIPNSGSYNWTVTGPTTGSGTITVLWHEDTIIGDVSDDSFTIAGAINVTTPCGGETWVIGSRQDITWTCTDLICDTVKIDISRDGGSEWINIIDGTPNNGSYTWTVAGVTDRARIRVSGLNESISGSSAADFTITSDVPAISLVNPNGGENWLVDKDQVISWVSNNIEGNIDIAISRDDGSTWTDIVTDTVNDGTCGWLVVGPAGTQTRIKVSSRDNPSVFDISDAAFTISGAITLLTPNGGEELRPGSTQTIKWDRTHLDQYSFINIEISRNGGVEWDHITSVYNSGSYEWTVTGPPAANARIRVSAAGGTIFDTSDSNFCITPTISVIGPSSFTTWPWDVRAGNDITIQWTSDMALDDFVKIELSRDGSWENIVERIPNSGSYTWTATGPYAGQARIRVSMADDPSIYDVSEPFTIRVATITLLSPNGGETLMGESFNTITWDADGFYLPDDPNDLLKIYYSRDSGHTWECVAPVGFGEIRVTAEHYLNCYIPGPATTHARIKLQAYNGTNVSATSATDFTVTDNPFVVTSPSGGEVWSVNSPQNITWISVYDEIVDIDISRDGGATWSNIVQNAENTGSYLWSVTGPPTDWAKIRIKSSVSPASIFGTSEADFSICEIHTVTFNSQGGNQVDTQTVSCNNPAVEPSEPDRTGYTFAGWFREPTCITPWNFNTVVTGDMTLYAGWRVIMGSGGTGGQVQLDFGTTELKLEGSTSLDFQDGINTAVGNQITVGGQSHNLRAYSGGDLNNENLTEPQNIGGQNVLVQQAVRLESGLQGEPIIISNSGNADFSLSIPDSTTIMAADNWDGTMIPPRVVETLGTAPSGFTIGDTAIEVGSPSGILLFDKPVTLELKGVTGTVGYKPASSDTWVRITQKAGGTYDNPEAPEFPGEAFISNGSDTKIITWHFTSFAGLQEIPVSSGSGNFSDSESLSTVSFASTDTFIVASTYIDKKISANPDGQLVEAFTIRAEAAEQIEKAKAAGKTSVQFSVESSLTSVTNVNISAAVFESAADLNVTITTPNATLGLPVALVNALAEAGEGLSLTVTRGGKVTTPVDTTLLGTPTTINTDIVGTTKVTIPLSGIVIPIDRQERETFLASLSVFTLHSVGDEQLINVEIIYDTNGYPVGITFPVDKFSTFAIVKLTKKTVTFTIDRDGAAINGISLTLDASPFIDKKVKRTLAPLRFIGEALGAKVEWLPATRQVRIKDGTKEIILTLDSTDVLINGNKTKIDCAPVIAPPGRTFLPLRFVSETLGAQVTYNDVTRQISIVREYNKK